MQQQNLSFRLSFLLLAAASLSAASTPAISGCSVFPSTNVWNTPVNTLPVDPNSAAYIASMNATKSTIYPDFNTILTWGMPYNVASGTTPKVPVTFAYAGESDAGPYPIPATVTIQPGADRHIIIVDSTNCVLYETASTAGSATAGWSASSGAIWSLKSNALRTSGWTSADAAGLPIFPGMVRVDEVLAGSINHALRLTADHTRNTFIWPARHAASKLTGTQYPPMGQRFRLKASFDISGYAPQARVILQAMKTYGLILADNGPSWDLTGTSDTRWDNAALDSIKSISGNNFEAINETSLMKDPNSGTTSSATPALPTGWFKAVNAGSKVCLDIAGGTTATSPGVLAQQWTCVGATNQTFKLTAVSGGYTITARHSSLLLEPVNNLPGSRIEQWGATGQIEQVWQISITADGNWNIRPAQTTSNCLTVPSTANGAAVTQAACTAGAANQEWTFTSVN